MASFAVNHYHNTHQLNLLIELMQLHIQKVRWVAHFKCQTWSERGCRADRRTTYFYSIHKYQTKFGAKGINDFSIWIWVFCLVWYENTHVHTESKIRTQLNFWKPKIQLSISESAISIWNLAVCGNLVSFPQIPMIAIAVLPDCYCLVLVSSSAKKGEQETQDQRTETETRTS